ncbi:hypothetical protein NUU61_001408 [Penicillium alfredii]|uniref:RING-type domain-containing protein n=1 Tax=Penicillium alfredii TaxID=1506179 RepID=A0A9W9KNA3_9EURO|nr:uncharacterized protein NUU61_001408 [Penicillium alfredii]KAJ5111778.1 hypothetical protein NUU61_001408 [Penicillium alfredii]
MAPPSAKDGGFGYIDILPPYDLLRPPSYHTASQEISGNNLREKQVPWEVAPTHPATLAVDNTSSESHSVRIHSFSKIPTLEDVECRICHGEYRDESVILQCEDCTNIVHLGCMEDWLANRSPVNRVSCPICRGQQAFNTFHYTGTEAGNFPGSVSRERNSDHFSSPERHPHPLRSLRNPSVDRSTQDPYSGRERSQTAARGTRSADSSSQQSTLRRSTRRPRYPDWFRP